MRKDRNSNNSMRCIEQSFRCKIDVYLKCWLQCYWQPRASNQGSSAALQVKQRICEGRVVPSRPLCPNNLWSNHIEFYHHEGSKRVQQTALQSPFITTCLCSQLRSAPKSRPIPRSTNYSSNCFSIIAALQLYVLQYCSSVHDM
jgi:hypothetical protein